MSSYWLSLMLGWAGAVALCFARRRRYSVPAIAVCDFALLAFPLALGGTHVLFALVHPNSLAGWRAFFLTPQGWRAGHTSFGGIAGVFAAMMIAGRLHGVRSRVLADLAAPGVFVMSAIGSIGCFLNGCCYGAPADLPWAMEFQTHDPLHPLTPPSHPLQLYEAAASLLAWFAVLKLIQYLPRDAADGMEISTCLLAYFAERFVLEFFRIGGSTQAALAGLSPGQLICIAAIGCIVASAGAKRLRHSSLY